MTIEDIISTRQIREVVHFTTHVGLTGILDQRSVKSRTLLSETKRLAHILKLNTTRVLDPGWERYVNLSISRINTRLYDISSIKWHPEAEWRILSFSPEIMSRAGVHFATTNNAYPMVKRGKTAIDLESLFAPTVLGRYESRSTRQPDMPSWHTTDIQAEVLFPEELSTRFLNCIYVKTAEEQDDVYALTEVVGHDPVTIIVAPERFE